MAKSKETAVGIMLGMATESFLIKEGVGGPSNAPYPIHKVTIAHLAAYLISLKVSEPRMNYIAISRPA
jgi:hypothetical protein